MSHTVQVKSIQCKNEEALLAACRTLDLPVKAHGRHKLYGSNSAVGIGIQLPGWKHLVVVDTKEGTASFDNFNGTWGAEIELDKLMQQYTVECSKHQALMQGYTTEQEVLADGSIKFAMVSY